MKISGIFFVSNKPEEFFLIPIRVIRVICG